MTSIEKYSDHARRQIVCAAPHHSLEILPTCQGTLQKHRQQLQQLELFPPQGLRRQRASIPRNQQCIILPRSRGSVVGLAITRQGCEGEKCVERILKYWTFGTVPS
jgi:hypothetical protein